jgi:hypothetical protein
MRKQKKQKRNTSEGICPPHPFHSRWPSRCVRSAQAANSHILKFNGTSLHTHHHPSAYNNSVQFLTKFALLPTPLPSVLLCLRSMDSRIRTSPVPHTLFTNGGLKKSSKHSCNIKKIDFEIWRLAGRLSSDSIACLDGIEMMNVPGQNGNMNSMSMS